MTYKSQRCKGANQTHFVAKLNIYAVVAVVVGGEEKEEEEEAEEDGSGGAAIKTQNAQHNVGKKSIKIRHTKVLALWKKVAGSSKNKTENVSHIKSHDITSRDITSHITSRHDTWHDISQPTTLLRLPANCITSSRLATKPRGIVPHHITAHHHHRHTTETQPATARTTQPKQYDREWLKAGAHKKLGLGSALAGGPAHII